MSEELLGGAALERALASLPAWRLSPEGRLTRRWTFRDFKQAFAFMTQVALLAEAQGHHPDWSNVYSRVSIALWTHDLGGLSERDLRLARAIDALEAP